MAVNDTTEYIPIKVNSGIILHIGAGIYSSVAGAIKELVSNAYDADASNVSINTDYPVFSEFRVVDNGAGMTDARFKQALQSIGSSLKGTLEPQRETQKYHRPVVGRLGIGLMALSQVCDEAIIESQVLGSKKKFIAKLTFSEFKARSAQETNAAALQIQQEEFDLDKELDERINDLSRPEEDRKLLQELKDKGKEVEDEYLGYCMILKDIKAVPGQQGTTVTLRNIEPGVRDQLLDKFSPIDSMPGNYRDKFIAEKKDSPAAWDEFRQVVNAYDWTEICNRLCIESSGLTYQGLPSYHQFLWDLALMSPVEYLPNCPLALDEELLLSKKGELASYNFSLHVDGRRLLKPIVLPSGSLARQELTAEAMYDYNVEQISFHDRVAGEELSYSGYIFWQKSQIKPSSLRGVQIYIRNVGVGLYDQTLLNFSNVNATSRAGQISGEIYVDQGLERALNVDRKSFRETDVHYLALQRDIWERLGSATRGKGVIGKSIESYWNRKGRSEQEVQTTHHTQLDQLTKSASRNQLSFDFSEKPNDKPYEVNGKTLVLFEKSGAWPSSTADRRLSQRVLMPVIAAVESGATGAEVLTLLEGLLLRSVKGTTVHG